MSIKLPLLIICIVLLVSACDNEEEQIPAYLYIDSASFESNDIAVEGEPTHNISHVRVTVGGSYSGFYELPAEIPVLQEGETNISLIAAVLVNSSRTDLKLYELNRQYRTTRTLSENKTDTIRPVFAYLPDAADIEFSVVEGFSGSHIFTKDFITEEDSDELSIVMDPSLTITGPAGSIKVDTANSVVRLLSEDDILDLPTNGAPVYLEFDYRTEVNMQVGLIPYSGNTPLDAPILNLLPKDEWTKAYFDLTSLVFNQRMLASRYRIYLGAGLPASGGRFLTEEGSIYIDNVKLIYAKF